ncbi:hypothetical protein [Marinobacter sp.]|uniref:hypothetical protein n=1 Tax=Marinobacter sp. TaxID=50741 RepID=UPI0035648AE6
MNTVNSCYRNLRALIVALPLVITGCASIDFDSDESGLAYFEPQPYMFYTISDKCIKSIAIVTMPGDKKRMKVSTGIGSAELTVSFSNGTVASVGQIVDSKASELLTSVSELMAVAGIDEGKKCNPVATLYPIEDGKPNVDSPIDLPAGR